MAIHQSDIKIVPTGSNAPKDWISTIPTRPAPGKGNMTGKPPKPKTGGPSTKKGK